MQDETEFTRVFEIYCNLKPKSVVEIGSWQGGTLWYWIKAVPAGAKIVSVDYLVSSRDHRYDALVKAREKWPEWVKDRDLTLVTLRGNSREPKMIESVKSYAEPIDFLFIDGDHSMEGCKKDFLNYSPMVRSGGVIAFHDLVIPGIWHVWMELQTLGWAMEEVFGNPRIMGTGIIWKP